MATAGETIKQALRESNLIALAAEPTVLQQEEALPKLNNIIASVLGFEVGTKLHDWPIGTEGTDEVVSNWSRSDWQLPPQNTRLLVTSTEAETITLPQGPNNGARIGLVDLTGTLSAHPITLDAAGRLIEGAGSVVVSVDNVVLEWMYRADTGSWQRVTLLTMDDDLPFPIQFDSYFETMLAMRLNPRYGRSMHAETAAVLKRSESQIRATYRQSRNVRVDEALLRMTDTGRGGVSDDAAASPRRDLWMNS